MKDIAFEVLNSVYYSGIKLGLSLDERVQKNRYTEQEIVSLYQECIEKSDENFGIFFSDVFEVEDIGAIGQILSRALNLENIFRLFSLLQFYLCKDLNFKILPHSDDIKFSMTFKHDHFDPVKRQIIDAHVFSLLKLIHQRYKMDIWPLEIQFGYERPDLTTEFTKRIQCHYSFNHKTTCLIFKKDSLKIKNPFFSKKDYLSARKSFGELTTVSSKDNLLELLTSYFRDNLGTEKISLSTFSRIIGKHPRKIQRELEIRGTSFHEQLALFRIKMIKKSALSKTSLAHLSQELGFYDQSSFTHFVKAHFGKSPKELS